MKVGHNAAPLCQLLVVLLSLFRVVWDFLVGCLGSLLGVLVFCPLRPGFVRVVSHGFIVWTCYNVLCIEGWSGDDR